MRRRARRLDEGELSSQRPHNSRRFADGVLLLVLVLREVAQRSGQECLQGGCRGFKSLSAHESYLATGRVLLHLRSEEHSARSAGTSQSFFVWRGSVRSSSEVTLGCPGSRPCLPVSILLVVGLMPGSS